MKAGNLSLWICGWIMDVLPADSCRLAGGWAGDWFESGVPGTISISSNSSGSSIQHKGRCVKKIKHSNSQFIFQSHSEGERLKMQLWLEYVGIWGRYSQHFMSNICNSNTRKVLQIKFDWVSNFSNIFHSINWLVFHEQCNCSWKNFCKKNIWNENFDETKCPAVFIYISSQHISIHAPAPYQRRHGEYICVAEFQK